MNLGAEDQRSTTRWIELLASKILMGNEICEIDRPFNKLMASCLATFESTPFYLSNASWSVQTKHPSELVISPASRSVLLVANCLRITSWLKYLGGGQDGSSGKVRSKKELTGVLTPDAVNWRAVS